MKLIVGLGNPGKKYARTRHNVGFMVLDELVKMYNVQFTMNNCKFKTNKKINAETCKIDNNLTLLKPQTFMNNSGEAVKKELKNLSIKELKNLWVIHDDLDIESGRIKIHAGGSSGHHGIESIIREIGTDEFVKFRIGIGRPKLVDDACYYKDTEDFLLSPFTKSELLVIKPTIIKTAQAIVTALKEGIDKAMNKFN